MKTIHYILAAVFTFALTLIGWGIGETNTPPHPFVGAVVALGVALVIVCGVVGLALVEGM